MTTDPPRYLTAADIASELGVHEQTAQKMFREGGLPGRKIGKSWRTTRAALDAWIAANNPAGDAGSALPPLETK